MLLMALSGIISAQAVHGRKRLAAKPVPAANVSGANAYARQCAACHGAKGEGAKQYNKALTGSRSVGELALFITKSMPPGPRKCTTADGQKIAAFIHDAFYSPLAQARNKPARIALSRLTVRQFRNSVVDLVGSFREAQKPDTKRGLRGEYFKARRFQNDDRLIQRIDREVSFDFGNAAPVADRFDPHQFSIRWQGSVLAPDTGEYDFVIRTEHSVRLWVDDPNKELID